MKASKILRERQSTVDMDPSKSWLQRSDPEYRGIRTKYVITHNPSVARPGEEIYISLGLLGSMQPIDPNSVCLRYTLNRTDAEAKLCNNLSANLVQRRIVSVGGETLYDNAHENLMRTYTDLWLSQRAREELTEFGICPKGVRESSEGGGGDNKKGKGSCKVTQTLIKLFRQQKIPLTKIISDQGMMIPSSMHHNISFTLVLAAPHHIVDKGSYTLTSMEIEYDVVASPSLQSIVSKQYDMGKKLPFRGVSWLRQTVWDKKQMLINENINVSKKCLNQIVMLFRLRTLSYVR